MVNLHLKKAKQCKRYICSMVTGCTLDRRRSSCASEKQRSILLHPPQNEHVGNAEWKWLSFAFFCCLNLKCGVIQQSWA